MKRFKNRLPKFAVLILVVSLVSSISSYSNYDRNSMLFDGPHSPVLINDGPGVELSSLNIINYFDFELFMDEPDGYEIELDNWMFNDDYFGELFEPETLIESWMLSDTYFEEPEEEIQIESWMLSDSYFETE